MKTNLKSLLIVAALAMPLSMPVSGFAADGDPISTKASDALITTKVKAAFAKDKVVDATDIKVETDSDGMVQLSGTATKAEADKAEKIAKSVKGVTAVKNDIVVTQ